MTRMRAATKGHLRLGFTVLLGSMVWPGSVGCGPRLEPPRSDLGVLPIPDTTTPRDDPPRRPSVLGIDDGAIWAFDPDDGALAWEQRLRPTGLPIVVDGTLLTPVRGLGFAALEPRTGEIRWQRTLQGDALVGWTAEPQTILVSLLGPPPSARSHLRAFATRTGQPLWSRTTDARLGAPRAWDSQAVVPIGGGVVVVSLRSGKVVGQRKPPHHGHVDSVVGLGTKLFGSTGDGLVPLDGSPGQIDGGPLALLSRPPSHRSDGISITPLQSPADTPGHELVAVVRRVVMRLHTDAAGIPTDVAWIHLRIEPGEYVGLVIDADRVVVGHENGDLSHLALATGALERSLPGPRPSLAMVGLSIRPPIAPAPTPSPQSSRASRVELLLLLDDPDPRLEPAQTWAIDLLARSGDPEVRRQLATLAAHDPRNELRAHATRALAREYAAGPNGPQAPHRQGIAPPTSQSTNDSTTTTPGF